jgi:hypothetical protein
MEREVYMVARAWTLASAQISHQHEGSHQMWLLDLGLPRSQNYRKGILFLYELLSLWCSVIGMEKD